MRFNQLVPAERNPQQIKKWSDEIIELDADNAAGLKTKYRLRELLVESAQALKSGDKQKALAAIHEARDLPGLSDEQQDKSARSGRKASCPLTLGPQAAFSHLPMREQRLAASIATRGGTGGGNHLAETTRAARGLIN